MSPFDLFNPFHFNPLDPAAWTGAVNPQHLIEAAAQFPGGVLGLVFTLFWAPVGPGVPAGILLAHEAHVPPLLTFSLYLVSDVAAALVLHPLFTRMVRAARANPILRESAQRALSILMLGLSRPKVDNSRGALRGALGALARIASLSFILDVYTGGLLAVGLPVPKVAGWAAALTGDLLWFGLYFGITIVTARFDDDWRVIGAVMLVVVVGYQVGLHAYTRRRRQRLAALAPASVSDFGTSREIESRGNGDS